MSALSVQRHTCLPSLKENGFAVDEETMPPGIDEIRDQSLQYLSEYRRGDIPLTSRHYKQLQEIHKKLGPLACLRCLGAWGRLSMVGCVAGSLLSASSVLLATLSDHVASTVFASIMAGASTGGTIVLALYDSEEQSVGRDQLQDLLVEVNQIYLDLSLYLLYTHCSALKEHPGEESPYLALCQRILGNLSAIEKDLERRFSPTMTARILSPLTQAIHYVLSGAVPVDPILRNQIFTMMNPIDERRYLPLKHDVEALERKLSDGSKK